MNILLIGSGGREHALARAIARSPRLGRLHAIPGNPGIAEVATCHAIDPLDHAAIRAFCAAHAIDRVVIGPEGPLVAGLVDDLASAGIAAFGPTAAAAALEGSKGFTKDLCRRCGIPTADFAAFTDPAAADAYLDRVGAPIVVKADGLAAGKGVTVAMTLAEAKAAVADCLAGAFGDSGRSVIIEDYMVGEEISFFALCDGLTAVPFATAQDHKRVGDGDTGPNTGGMGAVAPAPGVDAALVARIMETIIQPTLAGMQAMGRPFRGVLFAGLMLTAQGPKLIEYNVRFGDPECQAMLALFQGDILDLVDACTGHGAPLTATELRFSDETAVAVVMAARGYPAAPETGSVLRGLDAAAATGVSVLHAGTARRDGQIVARGGRVLTLVATGATAAQAQAAAYRGVAALDWPEGFCRRDIGGRAIARDTEATR